MLTRYAESGIASGPVNLSIYLILKFPIHFIIIIIFAVIQVDTAGWLQRTKQEKGAASLSIMQSRKSLLRAHIIALVLDAEEVYDLDNAIQL